MSEFILAMMNPKKILSRILKRIYSLPGYVDLQTLVFGPSNGLLGVNSFANFSLAPELGTKRGGLC
jgi:hypothetical protein